MDLFEQTLAEPINILPQDGEVNYHGEVMSLAESEFYFNVLLTEVDWRCDQAVIFGKHIETKKKLLGMLISLFLIPTLRSLNMLYLGHKTCKILRL